MATRRSIFKKQFNIKAFGLEFWLPLPLIALGFWWGGDVILRRSLSYAYRSEASFTTEAPAQIQVSASVLAIEVEIRRPAKFTKVRVKTTASPLKKLEFEFATTSIAELEMEIATELRLKLETVRRLVRYQFTDTNLN
jgi:hypothetical protein